MPHEVVYEASSEWVEWYYDSVEDPTTLTPEVTALPSGVVPGLSAVWAPASWTYTPARRNRTGLDYRSEVRFQFGVGDLVRSPGYYVIWLRLDGAEQQALGSIVVAGTSAGPSTQRTPWPASEVSVSAAGFSNGLPTTTKNMQQVAEAVDRLAIPVVDFNESPPPGYTGLFARRPA